MAENNYPQDEFDRLAARRAIRGTHRRKESMLKWWVALVLIVVLAPTAGWAIVQFWGSRGGSAAPATSSQTATSSPATGASGPSSNGSSQAPTDSKNPTSAPSKSASPSSSQSAGGVRTDRRVLVLNGAGKTGLAAEKQQTLAGRGFSNVSVDNYAGGSPTVSTVFYPKEEDRATATAIARSLGISESQVEHAPSATGGDQIVVVLKSDITNNSGRAGATTSPRSNARSN